MGIGEKLRQSSKGRLSYERKWPENEKATKELLEEWTSPPKLSPVHVSWRSAASPGYSVRDGIIHMKTSTPLSSRQSGLGVASGGGSKQGNSVSDRRIVVLKSEEDASPIKQQLSSSPDLGRSRVAIQEYEDFWDRKAKEAVELRRETFKESSRQLEMEQRQGLIQTEVKEYKKWENVQRRAEDQIKEQNQEILRNLKRLKDTQENRKKFLDGAVQTVEGKRAQLEEEAKQHQLEVRKRSQTLSVIHSGIRKTREDLTTLHKSCLYKQHLPNPAAKLEELLGQLKQKADSIVEQANATEPSIEHINKLHQVYQQAQNALEHLTLMVENANKKGEEEKQAAEQQKALSETQQTPTPTTTTVTAQETAGAGSASSTEEKTRAPSVSEELDIAPEKEFEEYVKLQENLTAVETSMEELVKNPQMKQYRFDLQKCVNTPVNAISPVSGEHLRDKLLRLCKLLSGNPVDIGNKRVSAKDHPLGVSFCKHLLAKMIVKKAEEQVSSIHESAFAIAMVTVGVWSEHPDLGSLLLARFHAACPYLVPYYVPQLEGQSNEEHLLAQGYKFVGGAVEKQDKFLKRMSGVMRLYAALMLSSTPRSQSVHPYGIEHAWKWLTNVMNMKPHPDITATLIYDLLEVTGHALYQTYNKQFQKLLHHLLTVYMPKIQAVVMSGGPVARLQTFLENCVKQGGRISPPEGLLQQSFWYT